MAEEQLFSAPNLIWFGAGLAAEFFFLGFGITPQGMNVAADVANMLGLTEGFNAVTSVGVPGAEGVTETLDFGIQ